MGGVVKTVAKVAVPAAIGYATYQTGGFGLGTPGAWGSYGGMGSIGMAGVGGGLSMGTVLTAGSLAMQGYSGIQQQKYAKSQANMMRKATEERNKSDEARNRYNQLLQKRSRYQAIRAARIAQAQVGGGMGSAIGAGGTSGFVGAVGSIGTQAANVEGNINVAQDVGNQIGQYNTMSANYQSAANQAGAKGTMWQNVAVLGDTIFDNTKKLFG